VVASVLCVVAPNVGVLAGLRVLQGMAAAAGMVVALAVIRDLYVGRPAAILLSRLILVMGAAPIIAPTLGGALLSFTSWRGVFVALALYGLVLIPIAGWLLPETLPRQRRRPARVAPTLRKYGELLRDRVFVGLVLTAGLMMSGMFAYIAGSSFVFQQQYGFDEQSFGLIFGLGALVVIGASQLNAYLLRWFEPRHLLLGSVLVGAAAALVLVATASTGFGGLVGVLVPLWASLGAIGVALPNAPALALTRHGEAAGTAAALLGAVQFGTGALVSPLVGLVGNNAVGMGLVVATAIGSALLVLVLVVRPWQLVDADAAEVAH
jgi:DHA1 family bicyclomycin/chloramphenicol resistance-like MFS transporter